MNLDAYNQLDLIAQMSATIMGFFAVFVGFSNKEGRFSGAEKHFIHALVLSASIAIIGGLLPRALSLFELGSGIWTVALSVTLVAAVFTLYLIVRGQLRMSRGGEKRIHWGWHVPGYALGFAATATLVLAFVAPSHARALYVGALTLTTMNSLWCFVALIFKRFF